MRKSLLLGACGALALTCGMANSAAAQGDASSAARSGEGIWEGDIIVTARRREETAQETPVAMTVLNDALLERYAVKGIDSIASLTPGFITGDSSGAVGGSISLRGVGSGDAVAFTDQAVSINVDGVPISTAQIQRVAQMDLKQIEVLRGPQTLFFGKNSPGGIISLTTADPGKDFEAMVRGGYEFEAKEWSIDGTISAPLSDNLGVRLSGHYADMDGYFNVISPVELAPNDTQVIRSGLDAFPKRKELFLRGTLLFEPTDRVSVNIKGTYANTKITGGPSYFSDIVICPYGRPQEIYIVESNCRADGTIVASQIPPNVLALNPLLKPDGHRDNKQILISGTVNYELTDTLKLTSVTGYYDVKEDISSNGGYGLAPTNVFTVNYENEQVSEELRLASDFDGVVNFLIGGFVEDRKLYTKTYIVVPYASPTLKCPVCFELPIEAQKQKQTGYSLFGQLLFDVNDQVQLTAGGRYTHEKKKLLGEWVTSEAPFSPALLINGTPVNVLDSPNYAGVRSLSFNNFSPEVTATYKPVQDMMVFASFKKGFKSGGIDGAYTAGAVLTKGVQSFKPEKVTGFELGLKSTLLDRQLIFNLTGYTYDYDDLQVTTYDATARSFGTGNAAKARVRGIEMETVFRPHGVPGLELHASAAYNDAKFREFFAKCYLGQTKALGCAYNFDGVLYNTQDVSGRRLRKAPKFSGIFGGYYETPVTSGLSMSLSGDLSYSGRYNYGSDYQPYTIQKAFAKLDASLRLFTPDKHWELALIGRNLTNKYNLNNGIDRTGTGPGKGTDLPTCTTIGPPAGPAKPGVCAHLPDVIGTYSRGREITAQITFRY